MFFEFDDDEFQTNFIWFFGIALLIWFTGKALWRQKEVAGGSFRRWLGVTVCFVGLELAPVLVAYAFGNFFSSDMKTTASSLRFDFFPVIFLTGFNLWFVFWSAYGAGISTHAQFLEDPILNETIERLAEKMGVKPPPGLIVRSISGELETQAYACGFVSPCLVVADGVLHRFDPLERDAIIAHELGHQANGSLWWQLVLIPFSAVAGLFLSLVFSLPVVLSFTFAFWVGAYRVVSRMLEYDCDRRAGKAIGSKHMASALRKLGATSRSIRPGWLNQVMFAVGTHPRVESRIAALEKDYAVLMPEFVPIVAEQRRLAWFAFAIWVLSLTLITVPAIPSLLRAGILVIVGLIPGYLYRAAFYQDIVDYHRSYGGSLWIWWTVADVVTLFTLGFVLISFLLSPRVRELPYWEPAFWTMIGLFLLARSIPMLMRRFLFRGDELNEQIRALLQKRDYAGVEMLYQRAFARERSDRRVRHNLALAKYLQGDLTTSIDDLQGILRDHPDFHLSRTLLADVYLQRGDFQLVLEMGRELERFAPHHPAAGCTIALAARYLGDLDLADGVLAHSIKLAPEDGYITAVSAALALDHGDRSQAESLIAKALSQAPGSSYVLLIQTEILGRYGSIAEFEAVLDATKSALAANPFHVATREITAIEQLLTQRRASEQSPFEASGKQT